VVQIEEVLEVDGRPVLVMEFASGGSVAGLLERRGGRLSVGEVVLVGVQVADALAAAHGVGVVHRDIKPQNVLVGSFGQVKVCDFGISALAWSEEFRGHTSALSYRYASPEELDDAPDVGSPADVYSLGATLAHCLVGRPPRFGDRDETGRRRPLEWVVPDGLDVGVGRELGEVIEACLELRPDRRPSAVEVGDRLERVDVRLGGLRVRSLVSSVPGGFEVGVGPTVLREVVSTVPGVSAGETVARPVGDAESDAESDGGDAGVDAGVTVLRGSPGVLDAPVDETVVRGSVAVPDTPADETVIRPLDTPPDETVIRPRARADAGGHAVGASGIDDAVTVLRGSREASVTPMAPVGEPVRRPVEVTVDEPASVGRPAGEAAADTRRRRRRMSFGAVARAGNRTAERPAPFDNPTTVELGAASELARFDSHSHEMWSVAWSPDGSKVMSGSADGSVRVWGAVSANELVRFDGHSGRLLSVAWSPDGSKVVSGSDDRGVRVWDVASGVELARINGDSGWVWSVAWSPDGSKVVSGSADGSVRVWDAVSGSELVRFEGHSGRVLSVAWSPDGSKVVSGGGDRSVRVWNSMSGEELTRLAGHTDVVWSVAWSPDGSKVVSGSADGSVRVWDAVAGRSLVWPGAVARLVWSVAWSPDGERIASGGDDGRVRVWDAVSGVEVARFDSRSSRVLSVAWSPDGSKIVSGGVDGLARVWSVG
jgi:hypothetical protein